MRFLEQIEAQELMKKYTTEGFVVAPVLKHHDTKNKLDTYIVDVYEVTFQKEKSTLKQKDKFKYIKPVDYIEDKDMERMSCKELKEYQQRVKLSIETYNQSIN